ncbi:hypothetical protein NDU88_001032 [Pleurodeles waltl]|uniref:Uncharacterized protein n=1 Tax=Pleurodeles waltl TaxID=8319 RepID=A0AAV7WH82_PLEWA|nr:hypothetical protein NDU88_001032 [Pleurodeles waltl]
MGGRQGQKDAASQTRPISTAGGRGLREEPRLPKVKVSAAATTEVGELSPPQCATNSACSAEVLGEWVGTLTVGSSCVLDVLAAGTFELVLKRNTLILVD